MRSCVTLALFTFGAACGRVPTLADCRTRGTAEHELVGLPCDGDDADACAEGTWQCSETGELTCDDTSPDSRELCNGVDDDCDGLVDPGCDCQLLPPPDCDPDGDGLPPRACSEPTLVGGEAIACVCAAPPCADPRCQSHHADVQAAIDALAPVTAPTEVWVFAGTYAGFALIDVGSDATRPLRVAAHCAAGERAAVVIRGTIEVASQQVTLEGLRVDLGNQLAPGIVITDRGGVSGDQITLRAMTVTGDALSTNTRDAYIRVDPTYAAMLNGLTLDEVDVYGGPTGSRRYGLFTDSINSLVVRRSSFCRLNTPAEDIGVAWNGEGGLIERSLAREVDVGFDFYGGDYLVDEVLATACRVAGISADGYDGTIKNSRFIANGNGLDTTDGAGLLVVNNLFAGSAGYGAWHHRTDACCGQANGFFYNTFVANGAAGLVLEGLVLRGIGAVSFNAFAHHTAPGAAGLRAINYEIDIALHNLFFDNAADCECTGTPCTSAGLCQSDTPLVVGAPLFTDGPGGWTYLLSQPPEQAAASAALDTSSEAAAAACVAGTCLSTRTTSTTLAPDSGVADLGFHYPICP